MAEGKTLATDVTCTTNIILIASN